MFPYKLLNDLHIIHYGLTWDNDNKPLDFEVPYFQTRPYFVCKIFIISLIYGLNIPSIVRHESSQMIYIYILYYTYRAPFASWAEFLEFHLAEPLDWRFCSCQSISWCPSLYIYDSIYLKQIIWMIQWWYMEYMAHLLRIYGIILLQTFF